MKLFKLVKGLIKFRREKLNKDMREDVKDLELDYEINKSRVDEKLSDLEDMIEVLRKEVVRLGDMID